MDAVAKPVHSKQEFFRKAAWFSFLAPLSSALIIVGFFEAHKGFDSPDTQILFDRCVFVGEFLISVASLIMGALGMFTKGILAKAIAGFGILLSCAIGFYALIMSMFVIWGGC